MLVVIATTAAFFTNMVSIEGSGKNISTQVALEQLQDSIRFINHEIGFQIPTEYPNEDEWKILIAGRMEHEDGFISNVHCLEIIRWGSGKQYSIPLQDAQYYTE